MSNAKPQIQEAQRTPSTTKSISRHKTFKLLKKSVKKEISKEFKGDNNTPYRHILFIEK